MKATIWNTDSVTPRIANAKLVAKRKERVQLVLRPVGRGSMPAIFANSRWTLVTRSIWPLGDGLSRRAREIARAASKGGGAHRCWMSFHKTKGSTFCVRDQERRKRRHDVLRQTHVEGELERALSEWRL